MQLGTLTDAAREATAEALALLPRVWDRDHTVWGEDPDEIADRLGWLDAPERARAVAPDLEALAAEVRADGVTDVLLVGMGGSSLYPEVLGQVLGPAAGWPRLTVLDSTDPAAVLAVERRLPWRSTLLVPASKSGTTIEMSCHLERFLARLEEARGDLAGRFVVPITDPGSQLDARARHEGFRTVVHGQPDVGGRFSALTPFGLFPAALLGIDVEAHVAPAEGMLAAARSTDARDNVPAVLGATLAAAARAGRDKLTLLLPAEAAPLGAWIEQLVAESTGKRGRGILPVLDEVLPVAGTGDDRIVVALGEHPGTRAASDAGIPVVELPWEGPGQLAGEVARWGFATAITGALLGVNPFDQPDVAAAKAATTHVLATGEELPAFEDPAPLLEAVRPGGYLALLAFVAPGGADAAAVSAAAERLRPRLGVPVTVGIGPRYLHSTGQLHKGGPDGGVFLVVVGDDPEDADIPGRGFTFSRLKRAQAAGDLRALREAGRRVALVSVDALGAR